MSMGISGKRIVIQNYGDFRRSPYAQQLTKISARHGAVESWGVEIGGRISLHRDHHLSTPNVLNAKKRGILPDECTKISFDWHQDNGLEFCFLPEKTVARILSSQTSPGDVREVEQFVQRIDFYPDLIPEECVHYPQAALGIFQELVLVSPQRMKASRAELRFGFSRNDSRTTFKTNRWETEKGAFLNWHNLTEKPEDNHLFPSRIQQTSIGMQTFIAQSETFRKGQPLVFDVDLDFFSGPEDRRKVPDDVREYLRSFPFEQQVEELVDQALIFDPKFIPISFSPNYPNGADGWRFIDRLVETLGLEREKVEVYQELRRTHRESPA